MSVELNIYNIYLKYYLYISLYEVHNTTACIKCTNRTINYKFKNLYLEKSLYLFKIRIIT